MWNHVSEEIEAMFSNLSVLVIGRDIRVFQLERKDDVADRVRRWKRLNASKCKAYDRARYASNRESRKAQARAYYAANRDAIRARRSA